MTAYLVLAPNSDLTLAELAAWIDRAAHRLGAGPNSPVTIGPPPGPKRTMANWAVSLSVPVEVSVRNLDRQEHRTDVEKLALFDVSTGPAPARFRRFPRAFPRAPPRQHYARQRYGRRDLRASSCSMQQ